MGFEKRKAARIPFSANLCFWKDPKAEGQAYAGQAADLSESGMTLHSEQDLAKGSGIIVEFSLPHHHDALHIPAELVQSQRQDGSQTYHSRLRFLNLGSDELNWLRRYVVEVADPKLAASMGWGKAYFEGAEALATAYRILSPAEHAKSAQSKNFISPAEAAGHNHFAQVLSEALGSASPGNFRMLGSRDLKEKTWLGLELNLHHGVLHALAQVLWSRAEDKERFESGLSLASFHRDEVELAGQGIMPLAHS